MLFYCLQVHIGEEEVKHWQKFVYYFMDVLLKMLTHIRIYMVNKI